jgi:hypothetical protein
MADRLQRITELEQMLDTAQLNINQRQEQVESLSILLEEVT